MCYDKEAATTKNPHSQVLASGARPRRIYLFESMGNLAVCYSDSIFIPSNLFFVRTLYFKVYVAIPLTIASWISMISFAEARKECTETVRQIGSCLLVICFQQFLSCCLNSKMLLRMLFLHP